MFLGEREFLQAHDFDADVPAPSFDTDSYKEWLRLIPVKLVCFLQSQYRRSFILKEMAEETGLSRSTCRKFLLAHPHQVQATLTTTDGKATRWLSLVDPDEPTSAGMLEVGALEELSRDELARQAREDYEWIQRRGRKKRQASQIIGHW